MLACNREKFDPATIRGRLYDCCTWCADSGIAELTRLATTVETWWHGIEAFLRTGITNAKSEGINRAVKLAARNAYAHAASPAKSLCPAKFEDLQTVAVQPG